MCLPDCVLVFVGRSGLLGVIAGEVRDLYPASRPCSVRKPGQALIWVSFSRCRGRMQATSVRSFSQSVAAAPQPRRPFTSAAAPGRRSVAVSAGLSAQVRRPIQAAHMNAMAKCARAPTSGQCRHIRPTQASSSSLRHPDRTPNCPVQKENPFAEELKATAKYIAQRGRGILASDESNATTGAPPALPVSLRGVASPARRLELRAESAWHAVCGIAACRLHHACGSARCLRRRWVGSCSVAGDARAGMPPWPCNWSPCRQALGVGGRGEHRGQPPRLAPAAVHRPR